MPEFFINNIFNKQKMLKILNKFIKFNYLKNEKLDFKIPILLISFLPAFLLTGSFVINSIILLIDFCFIKIILQKKKFNFFTKDKFFVAILIFFISLILNSFFNGSEKLIIERQLGTLRFLILIFSIKFYLSYKKNIYFSSILKSWAIIFCVVSFDIIFELIFKHNLIGNISPIPGRISSFLGEELKIGNFYYGFVLISLTFFAQNLKNNKLIFFLILLFVLLSLLIGERSNFIKTLISIFLFFLFSNFIKGKLKILLILLLIPLTLSFSLNNNYLKSRYLDDVIKPIQSKGIKNYILSSHYGVHYFTAFQIFNNHPLFGIGLKQYRTESSKEKYNFNTFNTLKLNRWATHPHQIHFEFLCETGIIGYLSFLFLFIYSIFFGLKKYFKTKNLYLLSSIIFLITTFIPLIPSGSFFTTYTALIFWINYSILITTFNLKK